MKQLIRCDKSILEYEPKYLTTSECSKCGAIHEINPIEIDIPSKHIGPYERVKDHILKCLGCGYESLDFSYIFELEVERIRKNIPELFEKDSSFFNYLKDKK